MRKEILDTSTLDSDGLKKIDAYIDNLSGNKEEQLIHVLHHAQQIFGYLPKNLQWYIAKQLDMPSAKVNGVVTFYSLFSEEPRGKYTVSVCMGTACFVKGAEKVLDRILELTDSQKGKMSDDGLFTVQDVRCIGACGLAPVVTINEKVYGNVKINEVDDIIRRYKRGEKHAS